MPTKVPIEIFFIARTECDRSEMERWLKFKGVEDFPFPPESEVSDRALLIGTAGKRCYMSFDTKSNPNVTKIREDWGAYLDNVLASGHGSVLEHANYTFAIENVSRVFTGEMNRHRAGWAISEGSMRFIRFGDNIPYWEPDCIQGGDPPLKNGVAYGFHVDHPDGLRNALTSPLDKGGFRLETIEEKKWATRVIMSRAFSDQQDWYKLLETIWADELKPESKFALKKQLTSLFRRIVGMGCATGGVWTGNIRAVRHVMTMRCEPAAEEEILHVFSRIVVEMKKREPMLVGDFHQDEQGFWRPRYRKV